MSAASVSPSLSSQSARQVRSASFWWLGALFFLSGISGLMYEVVWLRMLTRILGSTVYATATVLAAFMAGLALGSLLSGRFVDRVDRPQRCYALLELGIGLTALGTLTLTEWMLPVYQLLYDLAGGARSWLTAGQVIIALLVLLLPTSLMGATLPTLGAYGTRCHVDFGRCVGFLYSLNTLGALAGVLASGFVLLGEFGETLTLSIGVVLNLLVAALAGRMPAPASAGPPALAVDGSGDTEPAATYPPSCRRALEVTFALSGFVALASEVIWSRMLLLYQTSTIYAFSSMLAVVLAGIGLGSLVGGFYAARWRDPVWQLARVQLAVGLAMAVSLHLFAHLRFGWFTPPLILLGPLSLLWGVSFPLGAAGYARCRRGGGRGLSALYTWNTCGCIAGSLAAGFVLMPLLGSARSAASLALLSLLLGLVLLWAHPEGFKRARAVEWGLATACLVLVAFAGNPYYRVLEQRMQAVCPAGLQVLGHFEEATATTTAFRQLGGDQFSSQLWVNGDAMTALAPVTKLMAHLPIALAGDPHDVLVICLGMGTTVRSASTHPGLQVRVVELVPAVVRLFGSFHPDVPGLLQQPNVQVVVDDGRNHLLMHSQQYDVITVDPAPPLYSPGTVNLYSHEFFTLCRQRLRPQGVVCVWVQPDRKSENKMIFQTFANVFEHVQVWAGPVAPHHGWLLLGSHQPLAMSKVPEKIKQLYQIPAVAADLRAWGTELAEPQNILDLYSTDREGLRALCVGAALISDDHPYTEFPLWRSLGRNPEYGEMISARPYKAAGPTVANPYE